VIREVEFDELTEHTSCAVPRHQYRSTGNVIVNHLTANSRGRC